MMAHQIIFDAFNKSQNYFSEKLPGIVYGDKGIDVGSPYLFLNTITAQQRDKNIDKIKDVEKNIDEQAKSRGDIGLSFIPKVIMSVINTIKSKISNPPVGTYFALKAKVYNSPAINNLYSE